MASLGVIYLKLCVQKGKIPMEIKESGGLISLFIGVMVRKWKSPG